MGESIEVNTNQKLMWEEWETLKEAIAEGRIERLGLQSTKGE